MARLGPKSPPGKQSSLIYIYQPQLNAILRSDDAGRFKTAAKLLLRHGSSVDNALKVAASQKLDPSDAKQLEQAVKEAGVPRLAPLARHAGPEIKKEELPFEPEDNRTFLGIGSHARVDLKIVEGKKVAVSTPLTNEDEKEIRRGMAILARLDHPNILRVADEKHMATELCWGTLDECITDLFVNSPPSIDRTKLVLSYIRQSLEALAYLHDRQQLAHRDIKPKNILMGPDGQVRLADFGEATKTTDSEPLKEAGTAAYMAPDQKITGPTLPASDIWSVGITLYQLLNGRIPQEAHKGEPFENPFGLIFYTMDTYAHYRQTLQPPENTASVDHLLHVMLRPSPSDRCTARQALNHPCLASSSLYRPDQLAEILTQWLALKKARARSE